jgi:hypothetical protein
MTFGTGHTVLAIPVPELEPFVRQRTEFYDASFISADPDFVHAHITVLAPFVPSPEPTDLDKVTAIMAATTVFDLELAELDQFRDGLIHLRTRPTQPVLDLTARLLAVFPLCSPYQGRFGDVVPHLTLDQSSAMVDLESVRAAISELVPTSIVVDRIDLQWWANDNCRLLHSWKLAPR